MTHRQRKQRLVKMDVGLIYMTSSEEVYEIIKLLGWKDEYMRIRGRGRNLIYKIKPSVGDDSPFGMERPWKLGRAILNEYGLERIQLLPIRYKQWEWDGVS